MRESTVSYEDIVAAFESSLRKDLEPVERATVTVRRDDLAYAVEWAARHLPSFGQHDRLDRLMHALEES